jgi:hypothetical protein
VVEGSPPALAGGFLGNGETGLRCAENAGNLNVKCFGSKELISNYNGVNQGGAGIKKQLILPFSKGNERK